MLVEESVEGWGEFELEVIRDRLDNVVIVCSIENLDPMGVHTGDSVCCAPAMTLSDREYQALRDAAAKVIRAVGVETGGSNVQFAVNRESGEIVVIEMNPRVSRSSALASKATGYPIAKVATRLAIGYTLDEIPNDITGTTPASFEPTIDYVVVKAPRFAFEKFAGSDETLTTQMKSVGEAMGIGRCFNEAYGKAMRSRELDRDPREEGELTTPAWDRFDALLGRLREGEDPDALSPRAASTPGSATSSHDAWRARTTPPRAGSTASTPRRCGCSSTRASPTRASRGSAAAARRRCARGASSLGVRPVFKTVDSCGGEVAAETSYLYSSYDRIDEPLEDDRPAVLILGSGPNRIGQGIEFDYCCVQAVRSYRAQGYAAVMVNCNPETVSTDYDTADRLYFEPLTAEDVLEVVEREQPIGVVVQFGGQTPLKLARRLVERGVPILGTSPAAIDLAEDRERFGDLLAELGLRAPDWAIASDADEAVAAAERIGYPVLVRPSYVLGGRAMRVCYTADDVRAAPVAPNTLVDRFVEDAIEVDVDAVGDGTDAIVAAVMEHVEEAGVHSGDSACVIPPLSIGPELEAEIRRQTELLVRGLGVQGLCNVQFAIHEGTIYVLEANPRASRTVPFVCKAMGIDLVDLACRVTTGSTLAEMNVRDPRAARRRRQGGRAAVRALPRLRPGARPGDALDRRGDGARAGLRDHVRQGHARGRAASARAAQRPPRRGVPLGLRPRQARRDAAGSAPDRPRLRPRRHARHRPAHRAARHRGDRGREGGRRRRQLRRRPGAQRQGRPDREHAGRPRRARRRLPDPASGDLGARCRASRRSPAPARRCRRSRGPGRSSPRACRSCTLDAFARGGLRAARAVRAGPAGAHVRRRRARAVPHAARALARLVPGAAALGGRLRRLRRHVPLPAARPGAGGARPGGRGGGGARPVRPRLRRRSCGCRAPARRRRVRGRAAGAARAAPARGRAARGLP